MGNTPQIIYPYRRAETANPTKNVDDLIAALAVRAPIMEIPLGTPSGPVLYCQLTAGGCDGLEALHNC